MRGSKPAKIWIKKRKLINQPQDNALWTGNRPELFGARAMRLNRFYFRSHAALGNRFHMIFTREVDLGSFFVSEKWISYELLQDLKVLRLNKEISKPALYLEVTVKIAEKKPNLSHNIYNWKTQWEFNIVYSVSSTDYSVLENFYCCLLFT